MERVGAIFFYHVKTHYHHHCNFMLEHSCFPYAPIYRLQLHSRTLCYEPITCDEVADVTNMHIVRLFLLRSDAQQQLLTRSKNKGRRQLLLPRVWLRLPRAHAASPGWLTNVSAQAGASQCSRFSFGIRARKLALTSGESRETSTVLVTPRGHLAGFTPKLDELFLLMSDNFLFCSTFESLSKCYCQQGLSISMGLWWTGSVDQLQTLTRLWSRRKDDTAPAPQRFLFRNMAPAPVLLVFMNITPAPKLCFHNMAPAPVSVRF